MKKVLLLALALALVLASLSFALAEEEKEAGLFELLDNDGGNLTRVASGVPVYEGALIAPASLLPEDPGRLVVSDGVTQWDAKVVVPDDAGRLALVFFDTTEKAARYGVWQLLPWGASVPASSCRVLCEGEDDRGVLASEEVRRNGTRCLLLTLTAPVPAGSPVLTADGLLAGIVAAEWAEGENRVLVLPAEEIAADLGGAAALLGNMPAWGNAPEGLKVSLNKNTVTIDWKDMTLPEKAEDETLYLVLLDTGNTYLNFFPAETQTKNLTLTLTPGRFYTTGILASRDIPNSMPESYAIIAVPAAEPLTAHQFKPVVTAIAEAPQGGLKGDEKPVPVTEVTEELLRSGRAYFYSHSTYNVGQNIQDLSLIVTLTDPNGVNYIYESSWIYMPAYNDEDIWFISLSETGLLNSLNSSGYPAGVYRMAYYVDGDLADEFTFELK